MRVDATHAEDGDMPLGLTKRGNRYVIRRRVPVDLVAVLGRRELTKALGTADLEEAKRRGRRWLVEQDEAFEALRAANAHSPNEADDASPHRPTRILSPVTGEPISPTMIALVDLDELRERRNAAFKAGLLAEFNRESEEALALYQAMLDGLLPPGGDDLRVIEGKRNGLRAFLTGEGAMGLAVKRRTLVPSGEAQNQLRALTTTTWGQLVSKWANERKPRAKTRKAHEAIAKEFVAIVGNDPVERLTKSHALRFKDGLVAKGVGPANLKTKLSRLKTLANYGYENDLIGVRIMEGIRAPRSKRVGRIPYTDEALRTLFAGPVHQEGARPTQGRGEAAFWLPLIAAYSGARLEEIAGLRVRDIAQLVMENDGQAATGWFFLFTPDPDSGRELKTEQSERETPIHPELIRLGLIRYARRMAAAGESHLFPRLTLQPSSGKRGNKWGEWFGTYRRVTCGITDDRIDFHSFRHTFKDAARNADVPEGLQRQMMGHEGKDVADAYGSGFNRRKAVEAIARIRIAGMPQIAPAE